MSAKLNGREEPVEHEPISAKECFRVGSNSAFQAERPHMYVEGQLWNDYRCVEDPEKRVLLEGIFHVIRFGSIGDSTFAENYNKALEATDFIGKALLREGVKDVDQTKKINSDISDLWHSNVESVADMLSSFIREHSDKLMVSQKREGNYVPTRANLLFDIFSQSNNIERPLGVLVVGAGNYGLSPKKYQPHGLFVPSSNL